MGFLKRLIGSEPTLTSLLGEFDIKSKHGLGVEKSVEEILTRFYLHTYSTNVFRIEIQTIRKVPEFSFFSNVTPRQETRLFDLSSHPTLEERGVTKYILADLKVKLQGVVLLISFDSAVLIFPSKDTYVFTKKK